MLAIKLRYTHRQKDDRSRVQIFFFILFFRGKIYCRYFERAQSAEKERHSEDRRHREDFPESDQKNKNILLCFFRFRKMWPPLKAATVAGNRSIVSSQKELRAYIHSESTTTEGGDSLRVILIIEDKTVNQNHSKVESNLPQHPYRSKLFRLTLERLIQECKCYVSLLVRLCQYASTCLQQDIISGHFRCLFSYIHISDTRVSG